MRVKKKRNQAELTLVPPTKYVLEDPSKVSKKFHFFSSFRLPKEELIFKNMAAFGGTKVPNV